MSWSEEQFQRCSALQAQTVEAMHKQADKGPESALQSKILQWCKDWARPCLSFRQSTHARGFLTPGWPDMTIAMPGGRTLYLELKTAKGIVNEEQKAIHLKLMALGHEVHVVRSFKRFLEIAEKKSPA